MRDDPDDLIRISEAARLCGFKSSRSIIRAAAAGRIRLYQRDDWWHVSRAEVRDRPLLTAGRVAKLAKCSVSTVRRRIAAGLISPQGGQGRSRWYRPAMRFTLQDVATVRRSLHRIVFGHRVERRA